MLRRPLRQRLHQLVERLAEFCDTFVLELLRYLVDADAEFRQLVQHPSGLRDFLFDTVFRFAVVAVGIEGFDRDRVHRIPSDERFNVLHIAVIRVLRARAGPEQPLGMDTFPSQFPEPNAVEDFLVDLMPEVAKICVL